MKPLLFFVLIFMVLGCRENNSKSINEQQSKNYIFLDYYENMNSFECEALSKSLVKTGKLKIRRDDKGSVQFFYNAGDCSPMLLFLFNGDKLRSVNLLDAGCLLSQFEKKYPDFKLKDDNKSVVRNIRENPYYDLDAIYTHNFETYYCNWKEDQLRLNQFSEIAKSQNEYVSLKRPVENPSYIFKNEVVVTIEEKPMKEEGYREIFSMSYNPDPMNENLKGIKKGVYRPSNSKIRDDGFFTENPLSFYTRTRSRYIGEVMDPSLLDKHYSYTISFETSWNFKESQKRNARVNDYKKQIEKYKPQSKEHVLDDI